ncbi:uncharacterized protein ARMOST_17382 [Armillaria ostoyae]|uniref:F-box domain-containing protein n=1 Tax=Armillaria ostoyae TaxID=47428 RepID=A0A284RYU7_ARMOS|nr:uncharacterized protein ARMOST_17382 [Armillaria ostoyae]
MLEHSVADMNIGPQCSLTVNATTTDTHSYDPADTYNVSNTEHEEDVQPYCPPEIIAECAKWALMLSNDYEGQDTETALSCLALHRSFWSTSLAHIHKELHITPSRFVNKVKSHFQACPQAGEYVRRFILEKPEEESDQEFGSELHAFTSTLSIGVPFKELVLVGIDLCDDDFLMNILPICGLFPRLELVDCVYTDTNLFTLMMWSHHARSLSFGIYTGCHYMGHVLPVGRLGGDRHELLSLHQLAHLPGNGPLQTVQLPLLEVFEYRAEHAYYGHALGSEAFFDVLAPRLVKVSELYFRLHENCIHNTERIISAAAATLRKLDIMMSTVTLVPDKNGIDLSNSYALQELTVTESNAFVQIFSWPLQSLPRKNSLKNITFCIIMSTPLLTKYDNWKSLGEMLADDVKFAGICNIRIIFYVWCRMESEPIDHGEEHTINVIRECLGEGSRLQYTTTRIP